MKHVRTVLAAAIVVSLGAAVVAEPPKEKAPNPTTATPGTTKPVKIQPAPGSGSPTAKAPEITLKVGDKAPSIVATKWVKGEEVKTFAKGKVYVVEFWATWCPPCIKSIPHLTELQQAHKNDVVVIGMASSERPAKAGGPDTRLENIEKFVKGQGEKMEYRVAYDADRKMSNTWMQPAGQGGIPCAFIVDREGKIAYIGHPSGMDEALKTAVNKTKG